MGKKIFILFLASLFTFNGASLYAKEALSLDGIIKEALQNNPDILAAKKRYEAAKARIPQAKSLDDPTVSLTFEDARQPF